MATATVELEALTAEAAAPPPAPATTAAPSTVDQGPAPLFARLSTGRKVAILFTTSFITFAGTFSSTSLFPATEEIAEGFGTTKEVINYSNAGFLIAMGVASFFWAPTSTLIGRKHAYNICICIFFLFSVGAALSQNLATWVAMRTLAGFEASFFMVAGQATVADIFRPVNRGTAIGVLMSGTIAGPALGPCAGGIIVTYSHWRTIFWLQAVMAGLGLVCALSCIPTTTRPALETTEGGKSATRLLAQYNPVRTFQLLAYPNVLLTDIACGVLSFSIYSLLTPPRYLINPRFHLTTPLVSGLFYLSPGAGFLIGTLAGGRWTDMTVRKRMNKRGGLRVAQDRLYSGLLAFFVLAPVATCIYGWSLEYTVGGLALPTVAIFFSAMGLMIAFSSLNMYCSEVIPANRIEVISGKYFIQYCISATGSALVLPLINAIGIGLVSTITAAILITAGALVLTTAKYGQRMQRFMDRLRKTVGERE